MKYAKSIEEYLQNNPERIEELQKLRSILSETELEETLKWGMPTYVFKKRNLVGIGAFKNWSVLWFHDGALLKDDQKVLVNAQEGKTQGMRQWRFKSLEDINKEQILKYVAEAVGYAKAGKKVVKKAPKASGSITFEVPALLQEALDGDQKLKEKWEGLTLKQRRDFAEYISESKRESTRKSRLERITPVIEEGKPLATIWSR